MKRLILASLWLSLALSVSACGDSASANLGYDEPFRVIDAQFIEGKMPSEGGKIAISDAGTQNTYVPPGYGPKHIIGHAKLGGQAVGIEIEGADATGYWTVVMDGEDLNVPGYSAFYANIEFDIGLKPGPYKVNFAAVDQDGKFGKPLTQTFTIRESLATGKVVATLDWDNAADLDLWVKGPGDKILTPKTPNTAIIPEGADPSTVTGNGRLDRDSNAMCVEDPYREENVVWADNPIAGVYLFEVHEFSACRTAATNYLFTVTVDGKEIIHRAGRVLDSQADGTDASSDPNGGTFMGYITCDSKGNCS
jgi:hypothetical protein